MGNPLGLRAERSVIDPLMRLAVRQHSLLTRRQWLDGGLSERQLHGSIESGAVVVLYRGVYALRGSTPSFERSVMAACLATGGVASHRCAAYLWRLRKFERPAVEVLVGKGHAPVLPGVVVRRTGRLDSAESTHVGAIPITSRARTLLDGLPEPEPQYPYRGRRIDFAYPEMLFGIEANSVRAHAAKEDVQRNARKANELIQWWILYFTYDDVHGTPAEVAREIEETIALRQAA